MKKIIMGKLIIIGSLMLFLALANSYAENNDEGSIKEAIEMCNQGNYKGAIDIFAGLLQKNVNSGNANLHYNLGLAYYSSGIYDLALKEFAVTQKLDKSNYMTSYFMGLIYESKALKDKDANHAKILKTKALSAWAEFLDSADPVKTEKIAIAQKHIDTLKEELNEN